MESAAVDPRTPNQKLEDFHPGTQRRIDFLTPGLTWMYRNPFYGGDWEFMNTSLTIESRCSSFLLN